ncbi:hypothetical protein HDU88_007238 [Geranomyces variabilis]|nr:hypothetical protein HDU88_007238 [Geranomyces variabilis]
MAFRLTGGRTSFSLLHAAAAPFTTRLVLARTCSLALVPPRHAYSTERQSTRQVGKKASRNSSKKTPLVGTIDNPANLTHASIQWRDRVIREACVGATPEVLAQLRALPARLRPVRALTPSEYVYIIRAHATNNADCSTWVEGIAEELRTDGYMDAQMVTLLLEATASYDEPMLAARFFEHAAKLAEKAGKRLDSRAYSAFLVAYLKAERRDDLAAVLTAGVAQHGFSHYEAVVRMLSDRREFEAANALLPGYISAVFKNPSAKRAQRDHACDQAVLISVGCGDLVQARVHLSTARHLKSQEVMVDTLLRAKPDLRDSAEFLLQVVKKGLIYHVVAYNSIIRFFSTYGMNEEAKAVWQHLLSSQTRPNVLSFELMIVIHAAHKGTATARDLVTEMLDRGLAPNVAQWTTILAAFSRGSDIEGCHMAFNRLRNINPDTRAYTAMMDAIVKLTPRDVAAKECVLLAEEMMQRGIPFNERTHNALMRAHIARPEEVLSRLDDMEASQDVQPTEFSYATAIDAQVAAEDFRGATLTFTRMLRRGVAPTTISYGALLRGAHLAKDYEAVKYIHTELARSGIRPTLHMTYILINALCKGGHLETAQRVFDDARLVRYPERDPSVMRLCFHALMSAYAATGSIADCMRTRDAMAAAGITPNVATTTILMKAHSYAGDYAAVKRFWKAALALDAPIEQVTLAIALDAAGHNGSLADLRIIVKECADRGVEMNENVCNSLVEALCRHGRFTEAVGVVYDMAAEGVEPTRKTYVSVVGPLLRAGRTEDARNLRAFLSRHIPAALANDPWDVNFQAQKDRTVESTDTPPILTTGPLKAE